MHFAINNLWCICLSFFNPIFASPLIHHFVTHLLQVIGPSNFCKEVNECGNQTEHYAKLTARVVPRKDVMEVMSSFAIHDIMKILIVCWVYMPVVSVATNFWINLTKIFDAIIFELKIRLKNNDLLSIAPKMS